MRLQFLSIILISLYLFSACTPEPKADFEFSIPQKVSPVDITFTNTSTDADRFYWEFGDGTISTEQNPVHRYNFWGTYNVKLIAYKGEQQIEASKSFTLEKPERRKVAIVTEYGTMQAELFNFTPKHRDNFIKLVEQGFYTDLLFHRVREGFMIQGGDPDSRNAPANKTLGMGGPGYEIDAEMVAGAFHFKGALAAARNGNPAKRSSGSQFYVVHGAPMSDSQIDNFARQRNIQYSQGQREYYKQIGGSPVLDGEYTVFGQVTEGYEVIDKIATVQTGAADRPVKDVKMTIKMIK